MFVVGGSSDFFRWGPETVEGVGDSGQGIEHGASGLRSRTNIFPNKYTSSYNITHKKLLHVSASRCQSLGVYSNKATQANMLIEF